MQFTELENEIQAMAKSYCSGTITSTTLAFNGFLGNPSGPITQSGDGSFIQQYPTSRLIFTPYGNCINSNVDGTFSLTTASGVLVTATIYQGKITNLNISPNLGTFILANATISGFNTFINTSYFAQYLNTPEAVTYFSSPQGLSYLNTVPGQIIISLPNYLFVSSPAAAAYLTTSQGTYYINNNLGFLATPAGQTFLTTPAGVAWLASSDGQQFLNSPAGQTFFRSSAFLQAANNMSFVTSLQQNNLMNNTAMRNFFISGFAGQVLRNTVLGKVWFDTIGYTIIDNATTAGAGVLTNLLVGSFDIGAFNNAYYGGFPVNIPTMSVPSDPLQGLYGPPIQSTNGSNNRYTYTFKSNTYVLDLVININTNQNAATSAFNVTGTFSRGATKLYNISMASSCTGPATPCNSYFSVTPITPTVLSQKKAHVRPLYKKSSLLHPRH